MVIELMSIAYSSRYVSYRTHRFAVVQHLLATCEVTLVVTNRVIRESRKILDRVSYLLVSSDMFGYLRISLGLLGSAGIFGYLRASSGICTYLQIPVGIFSYP